MLTLKAFTDDFDSTKMSKTHIGQRTPKLSSLAENRADCTFVDERK